jgi:hypothetical protein
MSLRAKRGNLLPIPEIASAGFVSLAMTEWGVSFEFFASCHSEGAKQPKNLVRGRLREREESCSGQAPRIILRIAQDGV